MISNRDAEEILKHEYHRDNFEYIAKEILLPDYKQDEHETDSSSSLFGNVTFLGESAQCDLTVFEVELLKGTENRRVAITQDMFKILKGLRINNALVAFYNHDKRNYRISLLTSKYEFDGDKIVKVISNPRRFSYSLGFGTKTKTAYKFLINKGKVNNIEELTSRFSVEVVNKEFYSQIAGCFTQLVGGIRDGKKFEKLLNLYGVADQNKYAEFAVRLIGRIMFCWFLREKKSEQGIPLVPDNMLSVEQYDNDSTSYYHNVLEPLFFELLNTNQNRRKDKYGKEAIYKQIPYLNGGLFSPHNDDLYKYDNVSCGGRYGLVTIPNAWFKDFYNVLGQYNFTVDENTSYDIELSIDPEMLGRIFENLLAEINPETGENAKKSTGSFYTPRDIVDYMVDSSLLEYLKEKTNIDEAKLKALISYGKEDDELAILDKAEKKSIINALYSVTVLDPACGSGAFPIGMLQKVVYILQEIDPEANLWFDKATESVGILLKKEFEKKFNAGSLNYIRKLSVIQNSIFGVDIQPIAVEIARLRCFLSLVIEEKVNDDEYNRGVNALPNLDFKFIIANSLMELDNEAQMSLFENQDHINELKTIREEYFNADSARRTELKLEFADVQKQMYQETIANYNKQATKRYQQLSDWSPFKNEATTWFDPEWMFGIKDGFDIVIGNPPYVGTGSRDTNGRMSTDDKEYYRSHYSNSAEYKINLYALFMELGIRLSKNEGHSILIVPDSFLLGMYFSKIRNYIINHCNIKHITMLGSKVFAAHVGFSVVYLFQRTTRKNNYVSFINATPNNGNIDTSIQFSYPQDYISLQNRNRFRVFFDSKTKTLIDKIEFNSTPLGANYTGRTGVRSKIGQKNIIDKSQIAPTYKKGLISGGQILPYQISYDNDWINIDPKLLNAGGWDYNIISNPKILVRQTADTLIAAYDVEGYYHLNNVHSFAPNNSKWNIKFILALFNSKLLKWYYEILANEKGRPMPQTDIETLESLPIKYDAVVEKNIVDRVDSVLISIATEEAENYLSLIDQLVYELYGLTEEEIAIVEGN